MTTVINNPGEGTNDSGSGMGVVVGVILAIVLIGLFVVYGLPRLRGGSAPASTNINVQLPSGNSGAAPAQ